MKSRTRGPRSALQAAVPGLLIFLAACGGGTETRGGYPPPGSPILMIGVDGLEWSVALPMVREGKLPALAGLMERGVYGRLETMNPTISPVIWTTIATGKEPEEHGILHFVKRRRSDGDTKLYTNQDRLTKALWNIFSDYDRRVHTIGWWMTFPAEKVNGSMVAQTNTLAQVDTKGGKAIWKGGVLPGLDGQVYPVSFQERVMEVAGEVEGSLEDLAKEAFGEFPHPHSELTGRLWGNTLWAFRADTIYHRLAGEILDRGEPWDLMLVYFGGPDVVGHRFWRYMQPDQYDHPPTQEEIENYGRIIQDYYAWVDSAIGSMMEKAGPAAAVLVLSDHGMHVTNRKGTFDPDEPPDNVNSGGHPDAPPGAFLAAGDGVRPGSGDLSGLGDLTPDDLPLLGAMLDIAPTVLALGGLPAGEDMGGRALESILAPAFLESHPPARVATHDTPAWLEERPNQLLTPEAEEERLEQLRSLGYIE